MESQIKIDPNEVTVTADMSTVQHWRERYRLLTADLGTASKIQPLLAEKDPAAFGDSKGFFKVQNLQAGSAGMSITMKAVLILEQLFPGK